MPLGERDYIYYDDSTDRVTGERRRTIFIAAGTAPISAAGPVPAFNEDAEEGSGWRRMPSGSVTFANPGAAGFPDDGAPVSLPEMATMAMTINGHLCSEIDGFFEAVTDYAIDNVEIIARPWPQRDSIVTLYNVWTILSDNGSTESPVEAFPCIFQGIQRELPEIDGEILVGTGIVEYAQVVHIGQSILAAIPMAQACAETYLKTNYGPFQILIDIAYNDADGHDVFYGSRQFSEDVYLWSLDDLYESMQTICDTYYDRLLRGAFGSVTYSFQRTDGDAELGSPYSHITWKQQNLEDDAGPGADLAEGSALFIGAIRDQESGLDQAGLLVEGDAANSWATEESLYDKLSGQCEGTYCRAVFHQVLPNFITVYFHGIGEAAVTSEEIDLSDMLFDIGPDEVPAIEYTRAANLIANCEVAISSVGGKDITSATSRRYGAKNERGWNADISLHNMPSQGEGRVGVWLYNGSELGGAKGYMRDVHNWHAIYHLTQPLGATEIMPVRVHHECAIRHSSTSSTTTPHTTALTLPTVAELGEDGFILNMAPLLAAIAVIQREGGLMNWIPQCYTRDFGNRQQARYPLTLRTSRASFNDIGGKYFFTPLDVEGNHSAQALLDSDAMSAKHLYGACILMRVTPYVDFGGDDESSPPIPISECTFLGVGY